MLLRTRTLHVLVLALVATLLAPSHAGAETSLEERRRAVEEEQRRLAGDLDVLRAEHSEAVAALQVASAEVRDGRASLAAAEAKAEKARARVKRAEAAERRAVAELRRREEDLEATAVQAYMGAGLQQGAAILTAASVDEAAQRTELLRAASGIKAGAVEEAEAARERLRDRRAETARAEKAAAGRVATASSLVEQLAAAEDRAAGLAASVEERIERALGEAAALAALDEQLSREIVMEQAALVRRLQVQRSVGAARAVLAAVELREVGGIVVNASIAERLGKLLAAAKADGIKLGGGGYRDPAQQIALRQAHCGPSEYEIYVMPASQCTPPTARPGRSMHERGLAIDFTSGGTAITRRDDPAFLWLAENAARWGFKNLPSEPWHWSTTGR